MSTTLHPDFLLACLRLTQFKPGKMVGVEAGLLRLALDGGDFTAADLPGDLTGGSRHISGAATGALVAQGLIIVVGRVPSPHANAKGRKLDLLRLGEGKRGTVLAWFRAQGLPTSFAPKQLELV